MSDNQLLPAIWILASMVVAVLVTLFFSRARADHFRSTLAGRAAEQVGRLIYFVGVPYAALLAQSISTVDAGVTGTTGPILGWSSADWLRQLSSGLIIGLLALIPIGLAARQMARAPHSAPLGVDVRSAGAILIDAAYAEIHWAFYRTAPLIVLGDVYPATLIGLGFVGVEMLVAIIRHGLGTEPEEIQSWIGQALLLAMSATLFILTRNLWLIVALHLSVELTLNAWATRLAARSAPWPAVPGEPEAPVLDDKLLT